MYKVINLSLLTALFVVTSQISLSAQSDNVGIRSNRGTLFSGTVTGGKPGQDTLVVYFKGDLITDYVQDVKIFYVQLNKNGHFNFQLPTINNVGKMTILLEASKDYKEASNEKLIFLNQPGYPFFYVKHRDSVSFNIEIDLRGIVSHSIDGNGIEKYLAGKSVSNSFITYIEESYSKDFFNNRENLEANMARIIRMCKVSQSTSLRILEYYKDRLEQDVLRLLEADIVGKSNDKLINFIRTFMVSNEATNDSYLMFLNKLDEAHHIPPHLLALSEDYVAYIINKAILEFQIKNNRLTHGVNDIYQQLKIKYNGILRDKLITSFLHNPLYRIGEEQFSDDDFNLCLSDAFNTIQHFGLKSVVSSKMDKYSKGVIAYNFALPDTSGNTIKLEDFKGKVVLIDIYSTICSGCRIFARTLKEKVLPEFKNNSNVVFVAISVEENKKVWLRDLQEGNNADRKREVCLWAGGMGLEDPYLKHYNIQAFPTLFLIDKKGRIFNSSQNSLTVGASGKDIIDMIYDALETND